MFYLQNASLFLVNTLISFALYLVLLRFWMQWVRADFRNELGQFIIKVTNPVVLPARKMLPPIGKIDSATLVLALLIASLKVVAIAKLLGASPEVFEITRWSLGVLLQASIYLFMVAIFVSIVVSWIAPHSYHPVVNVARSIAEPLMAPARKLIPAIGGIDFSPILVILFLQLSLILLAAPLLRGFIY